MPSRARTDLQFSSVFRQHWLARVIAVCVFSNSKGFSRRNQCFDGKRVLADDCMSKDKMSKLPMAAFFPNGSPHSNLFEAHTRNSTRRHGGAIIAHNSINRTTPIIKLADSTISSPVVLCVDGVLLWLLIAWITAGTAAIITLIVKSCRNRYLFLY